MTDFEAIYRSAADPWKVRTSWYERRKRTLLLASLLRERYDKVLEAGCGTGEITALLAKRCESVWAVDLSATAIARCEKRLADSGITNVNTAVMQLPVSWPHIHPEPFNLIIVSELAYYFEGAELDLFLQRCFHSLAAGGEWVMCHYTPDFDDRCHETESVHQRIAEFRDMTLMVSHVDERFQLDVWRKRDRGDS
ncbi:MAG TPA: class I SAM-dependent methyltransferase [Azoarcus sp.]|nr:class I SAM-dependent methyltransferase [Azoarcus sp.]